jgi:phospholipase C
MTLDRRRLLAAAAASAALPAAIARAKAIPAHVRAGTIADVEHVVIFMQENRGFDHYFGALAGVRGFSDPHPVPLAGGRTVWTQANKAGAQPALIAPFRLDTVADPALMRTDGTPHNWHDAQDAWNEGRLDGWPAAKGAHTMGRFAAEDIPFQTALAASFTLCDAYHCSFQGGTNTNRLFLFTGTNGPEGTTGGPSISNSHDSLPADGGWKAPYTWTTYPERLQAAGVTWRVYQDMADNFTDNPLVGFKAFRDAHDKAPGSDARLAANGLTTYKLDALKADVVAGRLPQVSWIVAPAADSEHPGPSSPAQGADFTARVLDALTANPKVWSKTVLLLMFDENDGYFDHVPPPAPPSAGGDGKPLGGSTVDLAGEYHRVQAPAEAKAERADLMGRPYGLGPRVPLYVISPWSRGGWINSQVFDHTSVIRFLEARFGVMEPNISPWRRAVCGDLTSAFDFKAPNRTPSPWILPQTAPAAARAATFAKTKTPPIPAGPQAPVQAHGARPSRALPYDPLVGLEPASDGVTLAMANDGEAGLVFHVYDLTDPAAAPRRYTVGSCAKLEGRWAGEAHNLFVLGPNGFHRRFRGRRDAALQVTPVTDPRAGGRLTLKLTSRSSAPVTAVIRDHLGPDLWRLTVPAHGQTAHAFPLAPRHGWYDLTVTTPADPRFLQRFAGRLETGRHGVSDPALGGPAVMRWEA